MRGGKSPSKSVKVIGNGCNNIIGGYICRKVRQLSSRANFSNQQNQQVGDDVGALSKNVHHQLLLFDILREVKQTIEHNYH